MRAAVFHGVQRLTVDNVAMPTPKVNEVVLRVKACGICGTDQHIYHGHPGSAEAVVPVVLGHELAGEVVNVGDGVTHVQPGDRVTVDPNMFCGICRFCRAGREHLCENLRAIGVTQDGGMAEFCCVPATNVYLLPDNLSYEEGALVEPLGCCVHGLDRVHVDPTQRVIIVGGGFIGMLMVQLIQAMGSSDISIVEPDSAKREAANLLGVTAAYTPDDLDKLRGQFDLVVECVGRRESMQSAVDLACRGGQVLLFGVASPDTEISVNPFKVFQQELTISGSFINPHTHNRAIDLLKHGKVRVEPLISHRFALDDLPIAMNTYASLGITKGLLIL